MVLRACHGVQLSRNRSLLFVNRYFLRKLRRVKKANGQILAVNEVGMGGEACALQKFSLLPYYERAFEL